mmetsp:Transcript_36892/g.61113  ORF Transcript_36892/g.61113 Transcript_36892/m.61113 type:complete len:478 (+) Transcript_36892:72-1505(+)|eukprot:CAMPEP_0119314894 /NCGR_PEP_ID=MMETSP1333-20130426/34089_1 /TAXON_ID=418940 /ORGANISM="Scyphosphaera apsteinii, Strain RCC1455" /LENGTH=477 /DNA_ID=CAMNT_0007320095 /DNA_START=62 /DNA_END=1495 /DNA_ORIENTATION=+
MAQTDVPLAPDWENVRRTRRRLDEGSSTPRAEEATPTIFGQEDSHDQLKLFVHIGSLFNDESLSDVQLVVGTRRFRCHKVILASMSTYFRSLFTGGMQESQQHEISLHGVDPDCCEQVLRLLYGQAVQITPDNLLTFMHLADFYGVPQLLLRTESLLEQYVTVQSSNCCAKLVEATSLRCTKAQQHCLRVVLQDFAEAFRQPAFLGLELNVLAEVLGHDELLCAHEEDALDGMLLWWEAQQAQSPSALDVLLPLVRWPLLSTETLSQLDQRSATLRSHPAFCELLLEGFRFHSADACAKAAMRASSPRCRVRKGMLTLAPLLAEGPWICEFPVPTGSLFPHSFSFVWNIPHFCSLSCLSMYSPSFNISGHTWKIYMYPKGNNNQGKQLSVYLDSGITDTHEQLHCTFKLAVINYKRGGGDMGININDSVVKESQHAFCKRAKDWGFREFMPLDRLEDPQAGYLNECGVTIGVLLELS